jgi:hypothetical protein
MGAGECSCHPDVLARRLAVWVLGQSGQVRGNSRLLGVLRAALIVSLVRHGGGILSWNECDKETWGVVESKLSQMDGLSEEAQGRKSRGSCPGDTDVRVLD